MKKGLKIGVLLPHTKLYGGVKRFLELGNHFADKGHFPYVFTPAGDSPGWFNYKGSVLTFDNINKVKLDVLFFTEPRYLSVVSQSNVRLKVFYFVRANENLNRIKKDSDIRFFANSTNLVNLAKKKYHVDAFPAVGGINLRLYHPKKPLNHLHGQPFVVLAYGRLSEKRKGTSYVVKACEQLYKKGHNIKLLLFETPLNEKMEKAIREFKTTVPHQVILNHPVDRNIEIFHQADVFVGPEKKAGWANTVVEAMASGIPVIASESGTKDFLFHEETGLVVTRNSRKVKNAILRIMNDEQLRMKLAKNGRKKVEEFDWQKLANKIILYIQEYM